jgi:large subunit ribosomal protein L4
MVKKTVKATHATKATRAVSKKTVSKVAPKSTTVKAVKQTAVVHAEVHGLTASVMSVEGKVKGKITLPVEVFGVKVNKQLIALAVRVYLANQREGGASTKTRGEVEGSTRKIYKQKGTGRARHGGIRAPIFVGGGITFGPVLPHSYQRTIPVVMKRKALASALTSQLEAGNIVFIDGLESLEKKTKLMAKALTASCSTDHSLFVVTTGATEVVRASRNIGNLDILPATDLNAYTVMAHKHIIFMKEAIKTVEGIVTKEA